MLVPVICAIDAGTSGVKVGMVGVDGSLVSTGRRDLGVRRDEAGRVEQSVPETWAAVRGAVAEAVAGLPGGRRQIGAVAVSSQRATFVPLDARHQPLTDWISWQDRRGTPQCEQLRDTIGDDHYYRITGLAIEPTAAISKLMWLREQRPDVYNGLSYVYTHQALLLRWLGVAGHVCPRTEAAYLGLFDVTTGQWNPSLCDAAGVTPAQCGVLIDAGQAVGAVSAGAAGVTGLPEGTPIVAGGGDLQCGALGVGAALPGTISVGLGSGGHCVAYLDAPRWHPTRAMSCQPHVVPGAWELEGIALSTSSTFQWVRDQLGGTEPDPYPALIAAADRAPAGSAGLLVIPTLNGTGAPLWEPGFRGTILGLTLAHTRDHLIRAFIEGICYELRLILDEILAMGIPVDEIRLWGGPARSAQWRQIVADVFGRPVLHAGPDAGIVGAAVLGATGVGLHDSIPAAVAAMVQITGTCMPDPATTAIQQHGVDRYRHAMDALRSSGIYLGRENGPGRTGLGEVQRATS